MLTRMANIDLISGRRAEAPKAFLVDVFAEGKVMEANFKFKFVNFHLTSRREGSMDFHALAFASNRKETSEPFNGEEKISFSKLIICIVEAAQGSQLFFVFVKREVSR